MARKIIKKFKVPLKENYWAQKWCVDVHNISSSKKLDRTIPLEVSEGFTQEISKFSFHIREKVLYFNKSKAPENPWQHGRWMGFADLTRDGMCYNIRMEGKKTCYLICSVICTYRKNIGNGEDYVNDYAKHAPELEDMEMGLLNTSKKPIFEYQKYDLTPA